MFNYFLLLEDSKLETSIICIFVHGALNESSELQIHYTLKERNS